MSMPQDSQQPSKNESNARITLGFLQSLLLTLFGATGMVSMVVDGPQWITIPALLATIVLLLRIIATEKKKK